MFPATYLFLIVCLGEVRREGNRGAGRLQELAVEINVRLYLYDIYWNLSRTY